MTRCRLLTAAIAAAALALPALTLAGGSVQRVDHLKTKGGVAPNGGFFIQVDNPMTKRTVTVTQGGKVVETKVERWQGPVGFQFNRGWLVISAAGGTWKAGKSLRVAAMGSAFTVQVTTNKDTKAPAKVKLTGFRDGTHKSGFPGRQTEHKATWLDVGAVAADREPVVKLYVALKDGTTITRGLSSGSKATGIRLAPGTSHCVTKAWVADTAGNTTDLDVICPKK